MRCVKVQRQGLSQPRGSVVQMEGPSAGKPPVTAQSPWEGREGAAEAVRRVCG